MKFITGEPALTLRNRLVVSDLHLGIETEYWKAGFRIYSHMLEIAERLNRIAERAKAEEIIVNGDFKNSIAFPSRREEKYIPGFLERLEFPITVVKGNHDGGIERFVETVNELKIGKWVITHGHRNSEGKWLIIGHNHPVLEIKDRLGGRFVERVWVFGKKDGRRIIVMPAFNELAGGHPIGEFQGIAKGMEIERVVLLDGMEINP